MPGFQAVVLAAGLGTRMRSRLPKVVHEICGKPMIMLVLDVLEAAGAERIYTVVGHMAELVEEVVGERAVCILQSEQRGQAMLSCKLKTHSPHMKAQYWWLQEMQRT